MSNQPGLESHRERPHYSTSWGDGAGRPVARANDRAVRGPARLSANQWTVLVCLGVVLFIGLALVSGMWVGSVLRTAMPGRAASAVVAGQAGAVAAWPAVSESEARIDPRAGPEARDVGVALLLDQGLGLGSPAPGFRLEALEGGTLSLEELRGRTVVLNFWATWCTWCKYELPALQSVYEKYRDQGLVVLGVDVEEPRPLVQAYAERYGLSFPVVLDVDGLTAETYRVRGLPMTYFIDPNGAVVGVKRGAMREDELELYVRSALSGD